MNLSGPEEWVVGDQMAVVVRRALLKMPRKRRDVVMLRLDGGLSYREIARVKRMSEGSARVLVHMGIKQIKEAVEKSAIDFQV